MAVNEFGILLFTNFFISIYASYHWKVTESGKIQLQVENSGFPLTRQDDLFAILEQEQRLNTVRNLYKQLLLLKNTIDKQWFRIEQEGDLEKRLYSSDIDCLLGEIPLSKHNLNTEFLDYGQGSRPKMKNNSKNVEPDCRAYSDLDFSMRTFPHLETLNKRNNFNLSVNPVPSKTVMDFNIDAMLRHNSSDWTAYNIASFYWRTMGNGSHAVECARRALYFSPRNKRYIVLLNLGTLLQELQSLGEAAIVLHSAVDHDPGQDISHLALGNVYAALGDYKRSLACYENVLSLNPGNIRALQLKHALLCHKKLESGLIEIHSFLQNILQNLQRHNELYQEWLYLQNQVNWERDSQIKEIFPLSQPIYLNLHMLLHNVEHQAKSLNEQVSQRVSGKTQGRQRKFLVEAKDSLTKEVCPSKNTARDREPQQAEKSWPFEERKIEEEESGLENLVTCENLLQNKMNSLVTFIKSDHNKEINAMGFQRNIKEDMTLLKNCRSQSHYSVSESLHSSNTHVCAKDANDVKKLN